MRALILSARLAKHNAHKLLLRGLLSHRGKVELMPLIFDDLAEIHRVSGVSDEAPAGEPGQVIDAAPAEPSANGQERNRNRWDRASKGVEAFPALRRATRAGRQAVASVAMAYPRGRGRRCNRCFKACN